MKEFIKFIVIFSIFISANIFAEMKIEKITINLINSFMA